MKQYEEARRETESRRDQLTRSRDLAVTFWGCHDNMTGMCKELEENLNQLEPIALDPSLLHEQRVATVVRME